MQYIFPFPRHARSQSVSHHNDIKRTKLNFVKLGREVEEGLLNLNTEVLLKSSQV